MGKYKVEFPCGMKFELDSWVAWANNDDIEFLYYNGCPIHGKNCSSKSKKEVKNNDKI